MISEAFYFGEKGTVFGHFTPAAGLSNGKSILIVPSLFGEAIRSHRVLREVTKLLSSKGYDVLRFDFDGDGNSLAETKGVILNDWIKNIQDAYAELLKRSSGSDVSVLAVRFGAGLSLIALLECEIEKFVLWDPLLSRKEMHEIFNGEQSQGSIKNEEEIFNMFEQPPIADGFIESGIDSSLPKQFLELNEVKIPENNLEIVNTDDSALIDSEEKKYSVCSVDHRCDWQQKDLPVIFAPALISKLGEYF